MCRTNFAQTTIIRTTDLLVAIFAILVFLPFMLLFTLIIVATDFGSVFYFQQRIGKHGKPFKLIKFRTMKRDSDKHGLLTIGNDKRITTFGNFARKYRIDELPQLLNVLFGNMSLVGPRPEVAKYVNLYTTQQKSILAIKPGLTDIASIIYRHENEILSKQLNAEQYYISIIIPRKIKLNGIYVSKYNICTYFFILFLTFRKLFN